MVRRVFQNLIDKVDFKNYLNENFTFLFNRKLSYYTNISEAKSAKLYNGQCIVTLGYYTAGDGGGGSYRYDASSNELENGGTVHKVVGGGKLLLISSGTIQARQFGAKGDGITDDGPKLLALFNYNKEVTAKIITTPDLRYPQGFAIDFGYGNFLCSATLPLVNGTHVMGGNGFANEDGNLCTVEYTGSTYLFSISSYKGQWNPANAVYDLDIRGIGFFGKPDLSTSWIQPSSTNKEGVLSIYNSKIQHCGFRRFRKIDAFLICSHFQWNYLNFCPNGAVFFGGSDTTMSDNVIGGGSYVHNGVTYGSENKYVKLVHLNSFGNSRVDRNYVTGSFSTPAPIPWYIENSFSSQFTDNWYDYTDGPCLCISHCKYLTFRGGNVQGANRNSPMVNEAGENAWGQYECAILVVNSKMISIDKMLFREIPAKGTTPHQVTVRVWGSKGVHVTDYIEASLDPNDDKSPEYVFSISVENGSSNVTSYALGER